MQWLGLVQISVATLLVILHLLSLQVFNLLLESFDDLLAEVGSLCQFLLHFFMNVDVTLKHINLILHRVCLLEQQFRLL